MTIDICKKCKETGFLNSDGECPYCFHDYSHKVNRCKICGLEGGLSATPEDSVYSNKKDGFVCNTCIYEDLKRFIVLN